MSPRLRLAIPALLVVGVVAVGVALSGGMGRPPGTGIGPTGTIAATATAEPTIQPTPTPPPPVGGRELYGFVPYWEMHDEMAAYIKTVPVSTVALFSVTARANGSINTRPTGYQRIIGEVGRGLIADAHGRNARVELVFSSFGADRNARFFGRVPPPTAPSPQPGVPGPIPSALVPPVALPSAGATPVVPPPVVPPPWRRTVGELVGLAENLGVDGINVDVERLDPLDRAAYGEFLAALRAELLAADPKARLTVATEAGSSGIANARAASAAGVDRVFLMGYDYHWSGSQPGASSPVDRQDGLATLRWSIDRYVEAGVPRDRIILGLPLYGMTWTTIGPDRGFGVVERGRSWIPRQNLELLLDPRFKPSRDPLEVSEFFVQPDGDAWSVTYYDSPVTIRTKLALALDNGLAGGGFWAIGYERGLSGYREVMAAFREGRVHRSEAPARPPG